MLVLPGLPGAAPDLGEGAGGSEPGGLDRVRLDAPVDDLVQAMGLINQKISAWCMCAVRLHSG
jgi:hypothetical protein